MQEEKLKSIFVTTVVATFAILIASVLLMGVAISTPINSDKLILVQAGLTVFRTIAAALAIVFGFNCIVASLTPKLPSTTFAHAMVLTLLGLSFFTLSPWFAGAASIVFAADSLAPRFRVSIEKED